MLAHLTTTFTLALIVANMVGLALATHRLARSYILARVASPLVVALAAFFVEHFVGLGRLGWCWPLATAASAWAIVRHHDVLVRHWKVEAAFIVSFQWVFAWRVAYPGLVASSEKLGDLAMITSYLPGERLPPLDVWFPPFRFDVYYSFQHYAAALLGRVFDLGPGLTYNIAFCLLIALTITAAAGAVYGICRRIGATALVVFAFAAGGTGATIPVHLMMSEPQLYSSMRFIGGSATPERADTAIGAAIAATASGADRVELPSETFAYLLSLGDYHPMLSGFYLLTLALLCVSLVETGRETRVSQAVLAATPVVCLISNGWTMPLQLGLVLAWIASRLHRRVSPDWVMLAAGFLGAAILCHPFLLSFAYRSDDYGVRFRPVSRGQHTPLILGAILLYPTIVAALLPLLAGERRRWTAWASALWLGLLAVSEVVFVDDVYSGAFNRFNTTLKWWPWIQAGALLTSGAYAMQSPRRVVRYVMMALLLVVSVYALDMTRHLVWTPKADAGRLDGAAWITSDTAERAMLEFLRAQPRSVVLQRLEAGAFTPAPGLVLFAGQIAFLGWPEHEKLWRGQRADIDIRSREVASFYAGDMADSASWLLNNHIEHVLWLKTEMAMPEGTFSRIDQQIGGAYFWREYYRAGDFRVGIWSRRVPADGDFPTTGRSTPGGR